MGGISVTQIDTAGGVIFELQDWFIVEGSPAAVVGCYVHPHGPPPHTPPPIMVDGIGWFTIDGVQVCVEGSKASCGHPATGRGWFTIG